MVRGATSNHAGLPQHIALQHTGILKLPDIRLGNRGSQLPVPALKAPVHEYRGKLVEIMGQANDALWKKQ